VRAAYTITKATIDAQLHDAVEWRIGRYAIVEPGCGAIRCALQRVQSMTAMGSGSSRPSCSYQPYTPGEGFRSLSMSRMVSSPIPTPRRPSGRVVRSLRAA
jgi:hypothetical protein